MIDGIEFIDKKQFPPVASLAVAASVGAIINDSIVYVQTIRPYEHGIENEINKFKLWKQDQTDAINFDEGVKQAYAKNDHKLGGSMDLDIKNRQEIITAVQAKLPKIDTVYEVNKEAVAGLEGALFAALAFWGLKTIYNRVRRPKNPDKISTEKTISA